MAIERSHIIAELQKDIMRLQGFQSLGISTVDVGLGPIGQAFPNGSFPLGAVHEFISTGREAATSTSGFMSGLLSTLMGTKGAVLWISTSRSLFPPALKSFGLQPDRFIFMDIRKENDVLWAMDEALKCGALTAVVGEMQEINFTASRRLQLAVEHSQVTGFVLRRNPRQLNTTACVSRWQITSLPSQPLDDIPGIGCPQWRVELLRMRNGKSGTWDIAWHKGKFRTVHSPVISISEQNQKVG